MLAITQKKTTILDMQAFSLVGGAISVFITILGSANALVMATLWMLYFSIQTVGQHW